MNNPKLKIDTSRHLAALGDLYGIFFEDLNHAADGGLYPEMIQNRSFEFCEVDNATYNATFGWSFENSQAFHIGEDDPLNTKNRHYLDVKTNEDAAVLMNAGFNDGLFLEKGKQYRFSLFAKPLDNHLKLKVAILNSKNKQIVAPQEILIESKQWLKYTFSMEPTSTTDDGMIKIEFPPHCHVLVDMVSLFPVETFKQRANGVRKDLAEALKALHPKFMRFPGGCLVHDGTLNIDARDSLYRWKNTIGPVEQRPARRNNWGYNQTLGLGFYEYFQLCEDIGAKPLPVMAAGYDPHHQRKAPLDHLDEWVDDALDLIEFANGAPTTKWGKVRADLGHPKPFHLEYLAIGNEEVGEGFRERYPYFHKAIRAKYPSIKLINSSGPFAGGGEFELGWESAKKYGSDLVDEHYYEAPNWFLANQHRYDAYPKKGPQVFLGEYASKDNKWYNAVVEASYMLGLERNADKVGLACYAPLFCNIKYANWKPDLIFFDEKQVTPSVNYYVQKLFMHYQGTENVDYKLTGTPEAKMIDDKPLNGQFGFEADQADIAVTNIVYQDGNQQPQRLTDQHLTGRKRIALNKMVSQSYTISFDLTKTGGRPDKGGHLFFGHQSEGNEMMWILGGWANADSIIKQVYKGKDSDWNQFNWHVEQNQTYHCQIEVNNRHIKVWIDNVPMNEVEITPLMVQSIYTNVTYDKKSGRYFLKVVNVGDHDFKLEVDHDLFAGGLIDRLQGDPKAENHLGESNQIKQVRQPFRGTALTVPAYSVSVLSSQSFK